MLERLSLRLRILLLFAALAGGLMLALGLGMWFAMRRAGLDAPSDPMILMGLITGFLGLGVCVGIWFLFDANVGLAIERLSSAIRARVHAGIEHDLAAESQSARYLGDLAPAAEAITRSLVDTRNALAQSVARETTRLAAEKTRLETTLADVPVAVLLCNADHELAFYNGQAVDVLGESGGPGLSRNLLDYLRDGPIKHAYERLSVAGDPDLASDLLCSTRIGGKILAGRMRVLRRRDAHIEPGYVLTLRDVTSDIAIHTARNALLAEVFDRVRRPAANLQTAVGVLSEFHGQDGVPDLTSGMLSEVEDLTHAISELGARYDAVQPDWQPLVNTRSTDLLDGLKGQLHGHGIELETTGPDLIMQVDGYEIVALWSWLITRLHETCGAHDFAMGLVDEAGHEATMRLDWTGAPVSVDELDSWLDQALSDETMDLTARSVLKTHGAEIWSENTGATDHGAVVMPIRWARHAVTRPAPVARAVVYDFDLLSKTRNPALEETRLSDLTCVVFDSETTGLNPTSDEVVQIAAVRLVNGKRVEREVFDTLVDPKRPIPASSTDVHGISDTMVQGAPDIAQAGRDFHKFAENAVLVAHNAPFDMEFLRRKEEQMGLSFNHPVLDTVLLSAVVFGQLEEHTLDALTARLGITIPEEARHTAIGDTIATAEAYLKLIPMLEARGIETFGQVLSEVRKHGRLLKDLNG